MVKTVIKENEMAKCKDCKNWVRIGDLYFDEGECRRFPRFARRHSQDYCGEFKPRENTAIIAKELAKEKT